MTIELDDVKTDRIHRLLEFLAWIKQAPKEQRAMVLRNALQDDQ